MKHVMDKWNPSYVNPLYEWNNLYFIQLSFLDFKKKSKKKVLNYKTGFKKTRLPI